MSVNYNLLPQQNISIDFGQPIGAIDLKRHMLGMGGIDTPPVPGNIVRGAAALKPKMVRVFLKEIFYIYPGNRRFDWAKMDAYMDSVAAMGGDVMASICIKPKVLYPVIDETIWRPTDVEEWQFVIGEMVKRYSIERKYVTHWAVGNEINIGEWGGCPYKITSPDDYYEYYRMTTAPVLRAFPDAKVGGPSYAGFVGTDGPEFFDRFLALCRRDGTPVDFLSYNTYSDNPDIHVEGATLAKQVIDRNGGGVELYVTEFNAAIGHEVSIEECAYTGRRAAALAAAVHELHARAPWAHTFQYHIYDRVCDPGEYIPFYKIHRFMARHWNDKPHRLGLFDMDGNPRQQYFFYQKLYEIKGDEVPAQGAEDGTRVLAALDGSELWIVASNYRLRSSEDRVLNFYLKNAPQGRCRLTVYRIDDERRWDDALALRPVENRPTYLHPDFEFSILSPADSVSFVLIRMD